ncbi:MAG: HAMP domain-containing sensor histidine kinase, partial [Candidatus Hydrothermarchaeales archaeon]
ADNSVFDVSLSMALLKDAEGTPIGIVSVSHDITEHLKAERELQKAYKDLRKLDTMKDEFLQNVSHEFRTPITSILTTIRVIKDAIEDDRLKELLEINERSAWRLNHLVGTLLDYASVVRDTKEMKTETVDIAEVITKAVSNIKNVARDKGVVIKVKVSKKLPKVIGDRDSVHTILNNLLNNAIKFNEGGGSIIVSGNKDNSFVEITVADTGIGIDKKDKEKVFDRFYQVDGTTTRRYEGTGLGLALTKKLVELQGGKISFKSKEGEGSRFKFKLPVEAGDDFYNDSR